MNTNNDCMIYLVGNQLDNEMQRDVSQDKAQAYARENLMAYFGETSAKTGQNIEEIFVRAAKMLYLKHKDELGQVNKPQGSKINSGNRGTGNGSGAGNDGRNQKKDDGCKC